MSKFVKDLLTKDLVGRLEGVEDCLTANVIGLDAILRLCCESDCGTKALG